MLGWIVNGFARIVTGVVKMAWWTVTGVVKMALWCIGFTAMGPASGSLAAAWMSSTALANGVGVVAGSLYAVLQSAAMLL
jgi:hypothetical protein